MSSVQTQPLDLTTSPGCSSLSPGGHCQIHDHPLLLLLVLPLLPQEGTIDGCTGVFITRLQHLAFTCLFQIKSVYYDDFLVVEIKAS